jgi:tyrosyl-tRNA synthetase
MVSKGLFAIGVELVNLVTEHSSVFPSKGEARKMIQAGGVSLNKEKITDEKVLLTTSYLLNQKYLLLQKGKKQYFLIVAE